MKLGFIGLGIMGKPMAKNLLKSGCGDLLVTTRSNQCALDELCALGAAAATPQQIGQHCDIVFTMLPNGPDVKSVILGNDGVATYMKAGSVLVDMSSINPVDSREIADALRQKGVDMLDAPVSGGEPKAIDGTLSFMVGGNQSVFDRCKPLLETMGASVVRCGEIGAGNTAKLANQIIVAVNIAAVSEAFMLVRRAGVDPNAVFDAIKGGLAGSTVLNAKLPMMLENNTKPGFKIDLHIKDLSNVMDAGQKYQAPLPFAELALDVMQQLQRNGMGQWDHSAVSKYYEALTGTPLFGQSPLTE